MFNVHIGRRSFLGAGLAGIASTALGELKHYDSVEGSAKSVIFIYLPGGMAAQESFDIDKEPEAMREKYGKGGIGDQMLLA